MAVRKKRLFAGALSILLAGLALAAWLRANQPGSVFSQYFPSPPSWSSTCVDCPSQFFPGPDRFLKLDKDGSPHLVYTGDGKLYHSWRSASGWRSEVITSSIDGIPSAAIAFDQQGNLHIAYIFNKPSGGTLFLYSRTPSLVSQEEVSNSLGSEASVNGLEITASGYARIPFYDSAQKKLRFASQTPPTWQIEEIDAGEYVGTMASFVLDGSGFGHISYATANPASQPSSLYLNPFGNPNGHLRYAYQDPGGWHKVDVDLEQISPFTSLALEKNGQPHISYIQKNTNELHHAYQDPTGWHTELVSITWETNASVQTDVPGDTNAPTSLAFDPDDPPGEGPCIAYGNLGLAFSSEAILLFCKHSGIWQYKMLDDNSGYPVSLLFTKGGDYQVASFSVLNYDLKWATQSGINTSSEVVATSHSLTGPVDLEMDKQGYAHILYHQTAPFSQVRYTFQDSLGWHTSTIPGYLICEDMALDSQGLPHLSCEDGGFNLVYAYLASSGWLTQTVTDYVRGDYSSIAVDSADVAHISYSAPNRGDVEYATIIAGNPAIESASSSAGVYKAGGIYTSLAFTSAGVPYISYINCNGDQPSLAHRDSQGWVVMTAKPNPPFLDNSLTPCSSPGYQVKFTSLVMDSKDNPHVAYLYADPGCSLRYFNFGNERSNPVVVEQSSAGCTEVPPALRLDAVDNPQIAYLYKTDNDSEIKFAVKRPFGWKIQTVDSTGDMEAYFSLALAADGTPWIALLDQAHGDLKLAQPLPGY